MARVSRHSHLKPAAIAMFEAGESPADVLLRYPQLSRGTVYLWRDQWRDEQTDKQTDSGTDKLTTATPQASQPSPPPTPMVVVMEGGRDEDAPLSLAAELRRLRSLIYREIKNPGPHSVAIAQLAHAAARTIELQSEVVRQQLDAGLDVEGGAAPRSRAEDLAEMSIEELDAEVDRAIYG